MVSGESIRFFNKIVIITSYVLAIRLNQILYKKRHRYQGAKLFDPYLFRFSADEPSSNNMKMM